MGLHVVGKLSAPINHFQQNGQQKTFQKPVGSLMLNPDTGDYFLMLDKSFNPMATIGATDENKGSVCLPLTFVDKPPVSDFKPLKTKAKQVGEKPKKSQRPSKEAIRNALKLLQVDAMIKQSDKAGHPLPFDDEIGF